MRRTKLRMIYPKFLFDGVDVLGGVRGTQLSD